MQRMLSFGKTVHAPDVRTLYDMTEVIYDKEWLQTAENFDLYFMCREMARNEEDLRIMREFGLRYDSCAGRWHEMKKTSGLCGSLG